LRPDLRHLSSSLSLRADCEVKGVSVRVQGPPDVTWSSWRHSTFYRCH